MRLLRIVRAMTMAGLISSAQLACQQAPHATDQIEFHFSAEERRVYDARLQDQERTAFSLSVRLGQMPEPLPVTAHFRGGGSYGCQRKSYTLRMQGWRPVGALEGSATDEFFLLSLCLDDYYVNQHTVLQLWKELGLFPFEFRYVELTIDGESRGVHLLVEKLDRLRIVEDRLVALLRRGYASVDVKYSHGTVESAQADYEAISAELGGLSAASCWRRSKSEWT